MDRKKKQAPAVIEKVFIDRLALTVTYLLDVLDYRSDPGLEARIVSSLDLIAAKLTTDGLLNRYYTIGTGKWSGKGTLQDYALVAQMFLNAGIRLNTPRYRELARQSADKAIELYYDRSVGILTDPSLGDTDDAEFLMEVNGMLAQTLMGLNLDGEYRPLIDAIITYFSAMGEILEDRLWDGENWEFTERYVPYLRAVDRYLVAPALAFQQQ